VRKSDITFPFMSLKMERRDVEVAFYTMDYNRRVTFLNCVHSVKIEEQFRPSCIRCNVALKCTAHTPTTMAVGLCQKRLDTPGLE